jgi:hypothetical protein
MFYSKNSARRRKVWKYSMKKQGRKKEAVAQLVLVLCLASSSSSSREMHV